MTTHIDVLSYLLGAIVFSVGFLSTRLHATADATRRQASDVSWRVRDVLTRGDGLGPTELAGVMSALRGQSDSIARLARAVNAALIVAIGIIYIDGLRLIAAGTAHPNDAVLLMSVLVAGGVAVGIVGEADARHIEKAVKFELGRTTLGRLESVNAALKQSDFVACAQELNGLRRTFPMWGLLPEMEAYLVLRQGHYVAALQLVTTHLEQSNDIYISGLIGCAAAAELDDLDSALRVLELVAHKRLLSADESLIRRAVRLRAAHLDELLDGDAYAASQVPSPQKALAGLTAGLSGMLFEGHAGSDDTYEFDLHADSIPELQGLLQALRHWNSTGAGDDDGLPLSGPFGLLHRLVLAESSDDQSELVRSAVELAAALRDGKSVESLGFALLASNHARLAINVFERAIALQPKSARVHWAHGVSCWRWGWADKAAESIGRAITLDRDDALLRITRRRIESAVPSADEAPPVGQLSGPVTLPSQRLQLALVGLCVSAPMTATTTRDRFAKLMIERALSNTLGAFAESKP